MRPSPRPVAALLFPLLTALALCLPGAIEAQPARISITVTDPGGKPLDGVNVLVTTPERSDIKVKATTNPKGKTSVMVPSVALTYDLALEHEGYQPLNVNVKPQLGETTFREVTMEPVATTSSAVASAPAPGATGAARTFTPAEQAFNAGVEALGNNDQDTALAKFLEAKENDPNLNATYSALAGIYLEKKQPKEALEAAQHFLAAEPGNPRGLRLVYDAHRQLGNQAEADKALKELQSLKGAGVATLLFNEGADALKVGDLDNAQSRFQEALEAQPDLYQAVDALMIVYARKEDWANAAAQAEKAVAHDPNNMRALRLRHEAYGKLGDKAKEKEAFEALAKADPNAMAGALVESGIAKFNHNDVEGATADLSHALELQPDRAIAHYYLGLCYTNTSKSDQAKTHLQKFLELAPNDPNAAGAREMLKYLK